MVDDHDYWENNTSDIHPDGWHIFRNTNPTPGLYASVGEDAGAYYQDNPFGTSQGDGTKFWRTIRWGKHLEIFIEEGRHHLSNPITPCILCVYRLSPFSRSFVPPHPDASLPDLLFRERVSTRL